MAILVPLLCLVLVACSDGVGLTSRAPVDAGVAPSEREPAALPDPEKARAAHLDREFPLYGRVTGVHLSVRDAPRPDAPILGWLRYGADIRARRESTKTRTCATGWHEVAPGGFACAGRGIAFSEQPPAAVPAETSEADGALPYAYYFVKEPKVPEYHRLPSRKEQQQVQGLLQLHGKLKEKRPERAARLLRGELPELATLPAVVRRFVDRGFFVAGMGRQRAHGRYFVTTVRGAFVQEAKLLRRTGSAFHGVDIGPDRPLPVAWAVRAAQPFAIKQRQEGGLRLVALDDKPAFPRHALLPWVGRERVDGQVFHRLADGTYLKHWFVAVAELAPRPKRVGADEPWVHVSLGQQTLVMYRGDRPVYATLVSTGLKGHRTPTGLFSIRVKHVSATMSDIGPEVGEDERYSIEDVPFTQYFERSFALHGAFWHDRFGLPRSHGCVNLAPTDARRLFEHTWPPLTDGWHGVSVEQTGQVASKVLITEE